MTSTFSDGSAERPRTSVLVVGAGIAGLACARGLVAAGVDVVLLDKSRGVGGRCATRRVDGQSVDHGLSFLHGHDLTFLGAIRDAFADDDGEVLEGWPERVEGGGRPCQPDAFGTGQRRLALASGLNHFPKVLAEGLDVRHQKRAQRIEHTGGTIAVITTEGERFEAADVVVALPCEQARELLRSVDPPDRGLASVQALLEMIASEACLSVIATFDLDAMPAPEWDMCLPEDSCVKVIAHDSSKRPDPAAHAFVIQGTGRWSRDRLEDDPDDWANELLDAARTRLPVADAEPVSTYTHRWRYARIHRSDELAQPVLVDLPGGARLGLAGEAFARGAGAEAAFLSGTQLASRLVAVHAAGSGITSRGANP